MQSRRLMLFSLIVLFFLLPVLRPVSYERDRPVETDALPSEIEQQLRTIEQLSLSSGSQHNPLLFSALAHLEEMLPRSLKTRRLQEEGKGLFLQTLSTRTLKAAGEWERKLTVLQKQIEQDSVYMRAVHALDRRLAACPSGPQPVPERRTSLPKPHSIPFDQMRPGDIMIWDDRSGRPFIRFGVSLFAWRATHTAVYLGESRSNGTTKTRLLYEATNPALGVRVSLMDKKWTRPGLHVSLGHVNGFTPVRAAQVASNAVRNYGGDGRTPYHIWPPYDKTYYREGFYCSQLVWSIYDQNGVDLDSNDWHFLAWFTIHNWYDPYAAPTAFFGVFPDEIKTSPHITWYYDQVNPPL